MANLALRAGLGRSNNGWYTSKFRYALSHGAPAPTVSRCALIRLGNQRNTAVEVAQGNDVLLRCTCEKRRVCYCSLARTMIGIGQTIKSSRSDTHSHSRNGAPPPTTSRCALGASGDQYITAVRAGAGTVAHDYDAV